MPWTPSPAALPRNPSGSASRRPSPRRFLSVAARGEVPDKFSDAASAPFLTAVVIKVRKDQLPTGDGIGYLEAKHHLLLSYCQDLVYYLLRKAKGLSVDGHPVVRSLVEIRLFLEKIRPIDKKMEYQIQKLTNAADGAAAQDKVPDAEVNVKGRQQGEDDLLGYRPNPDMMDPKIVPKGRFGVYILSVAARGEGLDKFSEQYARRSTTFPHRCRHQDHKSRTLWRVLKIDRLESTDLGILLVTRRMNVKNYFGGFTREIG